MGLVRERRREHANSRREARTGSGQTASDQQLHETRRCSSCHAVKCTSRSTHVNEMGDHRKPDSSLKAHLVVLGFTDPHLGAKPTASQTVSRCGRQLFLWQDQKAFECSEPMRRQPLTSVRWRSRTALRTSMRKATKISEKVDRCITRVVGESRRETRQVRDGEP